MFEIPLWERGGVVLVSGGKHLILELADSTEARLSLSGSHHSYSPIASHQQAHAVCIFLVAPKPSLLRTYPLFPATSAAIVDAMETLCMPSDTTLERTELCGIPGGVFRPANLEFPQVSLLYNPGPHWGQGDLVFGPQSRKRGTSVCFSWSSFQRTYSLNAQSHLSHNSAQGIGTLSPFTETPKF